MVGSRLARLYLFEVRHNPDVVFIDLFDRESVVMMPVQVQFFDEGDVDLHCLSKMVAITDFSRDFNFPLDGILHIDADVQTVPHAQLRILDLYSIEQSLRDLRCFRVHDQFASRKARLAAFGKLIGFPIVLPP